MSNKIIRIGYKDVDFMYNRVTVLVGINPYKIELNKPKSLQNLSNDLYFRFCIYQILKKENKLNLKS